MKNKFTLYALVVTLLSTTISWGRMLSSSTNSGSSHGSTWNSHTGSNIGGIIGGGSHK